MSQVDLAKGLGKKFEGVKSILMPVRAKKEDIICLFFAACPVLSLTIWWHVVNTALPIADAATYLYSAQLISQKFDFDGIGAGLLALYSDRGWRPTIHPALAVPFHWIDKSDVTIIVSGASIFFTTLLCYWTFRCFRTVLPARRAALATICCTTVPFHFVFSLNFFSELPLLAFSIGAVAHLLQSRLFREKRHVRSFAVLFALAACTRPVEAVIAFAPLLVFAVYLASLRGTVRGRDWLAALGVAVTAAALALSQLYEPLNLRRFDNGVVCGVMLAWLLGGLGGMALWRPRPLVEAASVIALIVLFWWLPWSPDLLAWVTAGAAVDGTIQIWRSPDVFALLKSVVQGVGIVQFAVLALIVTNLIDRRDGSGRPFVPLAADRWLLLASLVCGVGLTLLSILALGQADDPRRALLAITLAEIAVLALVLRPDWSLAMPLAAAIATTCAIQFLVIVAFANDLFPAALSAIRTPLNLLEVDAPLRPHRAAPGPDQRVAALLDLSVPRGAGIILIAGQGQPRANEAKIIGAFDDYALQTLIDRRPSRHWARIPDLSQSDDRFVDTSYLSGARFIALGNTMPIVEDADTAWRLHNGIVDVLAGTQLLANYDLQEIGRTRVPGRGDAVVLQLLARGHAHIWDVSTVVDAVPDATSAETAAPESEAGEFIDDRQTTGSARRQLHPGAPWVSARRGGEVSGSAWLGYAFATPKTVRQIRIEQPADGRRQDLVRVEKSGDDGASWIPVAALPYRLGGSEATSISLPDGSPARYWRIVAAGLADTGKAKQDLDIWRISRLEFLVPSGGDGYAIGSGGTDPERAFVDNLTNQWVSTARGAEVKGHAWVGYAFDKPQVVRRIEFAQAANRPYRQDHVMVQASGDAGATWHDVLDQPAVIEDQGRARIELPGTTAATHWRVVAAGDNATERAHSWGVADLGFFLAPTSRASQY